MRAYFERLEHPGAIIRLTYDDELRYGKRTPYFWSCVAQILREPSHELPGGLATLHGAFGKFTTEMYRAVEQNLAEEGFSEAEWERWQNGNLRLSPSVTVRGWQPEGEKV